MMDCLLSWKKTKNQECLLIKGARQVGKTFIVQQFAAENYAADHYIELNFLFRPELISLFSRDLRIDSLILNLSAFFPGKEFVPGKTLLSR